MPRIARLVVPDIPHHVTQRGNRRQRVFFSAGDGRLYLRLLKEGCEKAGTRIWAWCLMPNHVHLILVPAHEGGLRAALAEPHRRYAAAVNRRSDWKGHLWQVAGHVARRRSLTGAGAVRFGENGKPLHASFRPGSLAPVWKSGLRQKASDPFPHALTLWAPAFHVRPLSDASAEDMRSTLPMTRAQTFPDDFAPAARLRGEPRGRIPASAG
jgi:REP element-mobilizing transposase RayT